MDRKGGALLSILLAVIACYVQDSAAALAQSPVSALAHGSVPVKVTKTLESSKLKEGDLIELETSGSFKLPDGTLVPKGSKLLGHVTDARARSKGDPGSELTISFDKLNISGGKQLAVKGTVQAVFPPPDEQLDPSITGAATTASGGSTRGAQGAVTTVGNVGTVTQTKTGANMESSAGGSPEASPKSQGVQGMHDLQLDNGVLTSKGKQVKLGNGVRMIVRVDILG
jgi:hypothetical protein